MPESANEHLDQLEAMIRLCKPDHVLDVGVGRGNYGWFLRNQCGFRGKLTGIEVWAPYVEGPDAIAGGNRSYYDQIVVADIRDSEQLVSALAPDVVFAFDVIEHMTREQGVRVIRALQRASQCVLVSVPIVPYPQGPIHDNPHEEHQYDWTATEMVSLGSQFRHRGTVTGLFEFPGGEPDCHVTVMLNTVREDSACSGRPPLKSLADDLRAQAGGSVRFELVAVDGLFPWRSGAFAEHDYPFRILHVPPKDAAMVRDRRCAISAYKNTGLAHARGDLVLTVDDCALIEPGFVERAWRAWDERGECLSALYRAVDSEVINDARTVYLDSDGACVGPRGGNAAEPPMFGFASLPMEAVLAVNGYDEMFDGSRGLEDMDMGVRIQQAGYPISLSREHQVRIAPQGGWSERIFGERIQPGSTEDHTCIKCSQTTFRIQRQRDLLRANMVPWSESDWAKVTPRCHLLTPESRCSLNGHLCPYVGTCSDREHPGLAELRQNPPVFDMRGLRAANGIVD